MTQQYQIFMSISTSQRIPPLQALLFRLPWQLWRHLEGGKMAEFGLEARRHLMEENSAENLANQYAHFFRSILHHNNLYFWQFVLCETLNIFVVFSMIQITDVFLNGRFLDYGQKVYEFYQHRRAGGYQTEGYKNAKMNPMCSLFPTVTS